MIMAPWLKISIRSKILMLLGTLVVSAVALYLYLASRLLYEDKTLLVYELNQTSVRTLGDEAENYIKRVLDKIRILDAARSPGFPAALLSLEEDGLLRVGSIERDQAGALSSTLLGDWGASLGLEAKDSRYLDDLRLEFPVPFDRVIKEGTWVKNVTRIAASNADSLAMMTVATLVPGTKRVVYADLRLDHLIQAVSRGGIARTYFTDSDGSVLAHSDPAQVLSRATSSNDPLVQAALGSKVRGGVKQFEFEGKRFLGSYYRLGLGGIVAVSRTEAERAFAAARILMERSTLYALMAITAAFLVALFLSHSLTVPIRQMVAATHRIAQGDFKTIVPISTRDELALLGKSFNKMTQDLERSRDDLRSAQQQLVQSERMAAIGQVARSIGHEFGNILLGIVGNADIALVSKDPTKIQESIRTVIDAADRASAIVKNLQTFSKGNPIRTLVNPRDMIESTLTFVRHETTKNSVTIEVNDAHCKNVRVNKAEIEQVLLNLMINAVHSMPGGGSISVGCADRGGRVEIWVKDTGTGIKQEVLPKIFDLAFTTKGEGGSGLGLAISKQIIEGHEGEIQVETELGKGTKFIINLPAVA